MIEKELKSLVTKEAYMKMLNAFTWNDSIKQINYYYADKLGVLETKNITVRARCIDSNYKLQVKSPVSEVGALHIKNEYEEKLLMLPNEIESEKLSRIIGCEIENVYLIGSLKTHRHIFWWDNITQLCLDENKYLGCIDYEVEIEYVEDIDDKLLSQLSSLNVNFDSKAKGKYSRFMDKYILRGIWI
jgi:uncharacterized protein YjbK